MIAWIGAIACLWTIPCSGFAEGPLLPSGPDPWIISADGWYYYTNTLGDRIALWKTRDLSHLTGIEPVVVWRAPSNGKNSAAVWAPELHRMDGKWYLYYAAADKKHDDDAHRHIFVLENAASDPTQESWVDKGMLNARRPGIDPTVFEHQGTLYFVYSAYVKDHSDLIIAKMRNPWTLEGPQVDIARPTMDWEMQGGRKIVEAPEFIEGPDGKMYLSYSGSACWSDGYALGLLAANKDADPRDPSAWKKSPGPVLATSAAHHRYAPGHNAFFKTLDGKQDWIVYHANAGPDWGCTARRAPYVQRLHWDSSGRPVFDDQDGSVAAAKANHQ
jgi:GH43 family beta-xylosidase